jgi:HSP20 family molecular chaperone IbpA
MSEGTKKDEFKEIEEMIRRILERTLGGQQNMLPPGFHIIVTGREISRSDRTPALPSRTVEEPATEVYEDGDEVRILVEVPGSALTTTHLQVTGRVLRIYADGGHCRYKTSVELPPIRAETMASRLTHGVLEITFSRAPL